MRRVLDTGVVSKIKRDIFEGMKDTLIARKHGIDHVAIVWQIRQEKTYKEVPMAPEYSEGAAEA